MEGAGASHAKAGIIPDFMDDNSGTPRLLDIKGISGKSHYVPSPVNGARADSSGYAARRRAAAVPNQYIYKAKAADTRYNLAPPGTVGPIERRLREFGPVVPLVFGWFGEINAEFNSLLSEVAEVGASRHWRAMNAGSPMLAKGTMMWALRRNLGSAIARANVRFLHDRLCFAVGGSAQPEAAFERRRKARARFFEDGDPASATWARRQQRFQRAPPQFGTAGASTG